MHDVAYMMRIYVDLSHQTKAKWQMNECWIEGGLDTRLHLRRPTEALSAAAAELISQVANVSLFDLTLIVIIFLSSIPPCQLSHFFKSHDKQSESDTVCYSTGGRGGRNAHFLVGDQDDSDQDEEEEEGGSPKKGYFSDPESEESEDKSKWVSVKILI